MRLYKLLFECITDAELWQEGLKYTQQAFQFIPSEHQKTLFSSRIVFLGKLGKDTAAEIMRVKESGPIVHAKAIVTLARSTNNRSTALQAYVFAAVCLADISIACDNVVTSSSGTSRQLLC